LTDKESILAMHAALTVGDLKAVCSARGFAPEAVGSSALFARDFLSDLGLERVMKALTLSERCALNLLYLAGKPSNVAVFAPAYSDRSAARLWGTFNQVYRPVFAKVKQSLVRTGVVAMTLTSDVLSGKSVLERYEFCVPAAFAPFLPLPFESVEEHPGPGEFNVKALRGPLTRLLDGPDDSGSIGIIDGVLTIDGKPFGLGELRRSRVKSWRKALGKAVKHDDALSVAECVGLAVGRLAPCQWVAHEQLDEILRFLDPKHSPAETRTMCENGWECGCLSRMRVGDSILYGPPPALTATGADPASYLSTSPQGGCTVDVEKIPIDDLETVAKISRASIDGGRLVLSPDTPRIGRHSCDVEKTAVGAWLRDRAPAYADAFDLVKRRAGRTILHSNLLIARVGDLSLRVKLKQSLGNDPANFVELHGDYVAFPRDSFEGVRRIVTKAGFAVKLISGSAR
jgi:hypothetical protein